MASAGGAAVVGIHLTFGQICPRMGAVKGAEFERRVQKLAWRKKVTYQFVADKGKGSHGRLYFGEEFTTLKDRKKKIGRDLLAKMCRDLNIDPHDL
jgi:mRNA interferase HicA